MKRFVCRMISLLLVSALVLAGVSCSGGTASVSEEAETETAANEEIAASEATAASESAAVTEEPQETDEEKVERIMAGMTVRDKICQMMIVSFRGWQETASETQSVVDEDLPESADITELNDDIREFYREYPVGSTLLFSENTVDAEQTLRLVYDMQSQVLAGGGVPMIMGIDQEGGQVFRLGFGTAGVGNMALAATGDPGNAGAMASVCGEELRLLGIQSDYAPVMDVNNNPDNPVIGVRSFSDDPYVVAAFGLEFMQGLEDQGVIATLKHFPGHGNTDVDSHTGFPCINSTYEELREFELVPFQAAVDAGVGMIMTAHIQYPLIEPATYISISTGEEVFLPATMSRVILTDILRDDMGFEGVVVSDALDMAAISDNFSEEDVFCMTINAGVDMLMLPFVWNSDDLAALKERIDLTVSLAEEGRIDADRIDESVRRILLLKAEYGILDETDFTVDDGMVTAAAEGVGSIQNRQTAMDIAYDALTLVRNENDAYPLDVQENESVLILFADSCASRAGTGDLARQMLEEEGALPEGVRINVMVNTAGNSDEAAEAALSADHVILVYRTYSATCLDPASGDGFSSAVFDRIIDGLHDEGRTALVITCQLPYDAARFDADAVLLCYASTPMRQILPAEGAGSAYAPNLLAAIMSCFGDGEVTGMLPVNIPGIGDDYSYTDEIIYERQVSVYAS